MDSFSMLPGSRPSRLNLSGRGTEYLLAGGLLVIIVGAVVLSIWGDDKSDGPGGKPMWQCQECKYQFEPAPMSS